MSDEESESEDLRRAIALSLQTGSPDCLDRPSDIIDLVSSDDEDDDLNAPATTRAVPVLRPDAAADSVSMHLVRETQSSDQGLENKIPTHNADERSLSSKSFSFMGLNRKQMEEDRLMRAKHNNSIPVDPAGNTHESRKRRLSGLYPPDRQQYSRHVRAKLPIMIPGIEPSHSSSVTTPRKRKGDSTQARAQSDNQSTSLEMDQSLQSQGEAPYNVLSFQDQQSLDSSGIQYLNGVVKKTWAYGFPREDDIKIEEVFQKADLEIAVLSAPQIDVDWIASKLNPTTKVVWVLQAKTELERNRMPIGAPKNYKFCFPSMEGNINCMHSKLQLLSHPTHLRICVPTANLVPYDWGETGVMENSCFLIDLPRKSSGSDDLTEFGKELLHFVKAMGLNESIIDSILKFDFRHTSHLAFVHSIGGSHSGDDWKRTGYCGLGAAIRHLRLHTDEAIMVDFLTASIGNLKDNFMKAIYLAAKGDDGLTEYEWRTKKTSRGKVVTSAERKLSEDLDNHFRIYFPTHETVANSKGGIGAGGTICFQAKWYNSEAFPRHLMRNCQNKRKGLLLHSKIIFVRQLKGSVAWAYVGSANLSESACWECGVVIRCGDAVSDDAQTNGLYENNEAANRDQDPGMRAFDGKVPVPMMVPGEEYKTIQPWFYDDN